MILIHVKKFTDCAHFVRQNIFLGKTYRSQTVQIGMFPSYPRAL